MLVNQSVTYVDELDPNCYHRAHREEMREVPALISGGPPYNKLTASALNSIYKFFYLHAMISFKPLFLPLWDTSKDCLILR